MHKNSVLMLYKISWSDELGHSNLERTLNKVNMPKLSKDLLFDTLPFATDR